MRRVMSVLTLLQLLAIALPAQAQEKTVNLTFAWEQAAEDTSKDDFYGWKVWYATTSGGPYTQLGADVVYDGAQKPTYTASETLVAPDQAETTFYFVVSAYDRSGNFSGYSNEVSFTADFLGPGVPVRFNVTIEAALGPGG